MEQSVEALEPGERLFPSELVPGKAGSSEGGISPATARPSSG